MTSDAPSDGRASGAPDPSVFVWTWLPGRTSPVVAGRVERVGDRLHFGYGRSYLERAGAVALYLPELPLEPGLRPPPDGLTLAGALRDALPDAWGRRVILARLAATSARSGSAPFALAADVDPDERAFMLESGSNRFGALDFQGSAVDYVPRDGPDATLAELHDAARRIELGLALPAALDAAIVHGSSIGGARPKALLFDGDRQLVAKFSSSDDVRPVVESEYVAMRLAAEAGLDVAPVRVTRVGGRSVLLVERFDRERTDGGWTRRATVSALTLFALDEMMARYASYESLAELVRRRFASPTATLHELFGRLTFNVLVGNTDDHARNHAAFWDGGALSLTPAYDVCPQARTGGEATQAMRVSGTRSFSRIELCLDAAPSFRLDRDGAIAIARAQADTIRARWESVCDECGLADAARRSLWGRQFLNPYAFVGLDRATLRRLGVEPDVAHGTEPPRSP